MNRPAAPRRVNLSVLAAAEKKLLERLAAKLPAWVAPDLLTATGVLGGVLAFAGYLLSHRDPGYLWLANLGLLVNWFGDSLDGTVARYRGSERPKYGFLLDQSIDVVGNFLVMAGAGLSPYMRLDSALLALAGYHALTIYALIRNVVLGEHHITVAGFGATEMRMILFAMNTALFFGGARAGFLGFERLTWCDGLLLAGSLVMAAAFLAGLLADARRLRGDPADRR